TAQRLGTDAAVVADLLQRLEEAGQIDDAFAGHQPLVVAHFLGRLCLRVGHVYMDDAILAGGENVLDGAAGVMPVPDVENDTDVRSAVLREGNSLRQIPDERMRRRTVRSLSSELLHTEEFDSKADVRFLQHLGNGGETIACDLALFLLWQRGARRQDDHHPVASDR